MNQGSSLDVRRRQIDTLKIFNANVTEVNENEYHVGFMAGGRQHTLSIHLGPNFPNEKPLIIINPPVSHQWVPSSSGEIQNAPGLVNFTVHSDLGRVVHAIIREFEKYPPPLLSGEATPSSTASTNIVAHTQTGKPVRNYTLPDLCSLTLDELKKLDTDSEFLNDYVEEMAAIRSLNEELDLLMADVEGIATDNATQQNHIIALKQRLNVDTEKFKALGNKFDILDQQLRKKSEEFEPQHIKELLQIATSNTDAECENYVEEFLAGKMDIQSFLGQYMESKKISAIRKAKEERLTAQLEALERAGH